MRLITHLTKTSNNAKASCVEWETSDYKDPSSSTRSHCWQPSLNPFMLPYKFFIFFYLFLFLSIFLIYFFYYKIQISSHEILSQRKATFTLNSMMACKPGSGAHSGNSSPQHLLSNSCPNFLLGQDLVEPLNRNAQKMISFSKQHSFCLGCF